MYTSTLVESEATRPRPGSISWRINSEVVVLLGWSPAVLMQLAHPLVAAGVAEHSSFLAHPRYRVLRLWQTVEAMLSLTFGTPEDAERAADGINRIHDRVNGRLDRPAGAYEAGARYDAHDPELLRWVQATLLFILPRTYELCVGRLSPEEQDEWCREGSAINSVLGIPEHYVLAGMSDLNAYVSEMVHSGRLEVTPAARELMRGMLSPYFPRVAWPLYWPARLWTIGLLPPEIRRMYGLPWDASQERALRLASGTFRLILPRLPSLLRHWPPARAIRDEAGALSGHSNAGLTRSPGPAARERSSPASSTTYPHSRTNPPNQKAQCAAGATTEGG